MLYTYCEGTTVCIMSVGCVNNITVRGIASSSDGVYTTDET
jgi:hypothetical protein